VNKRFLSNWLKLNLSVQNNSIEKRLLDEKEFADMLRYERERAERNGSFFSCLYIEFLFFNGTNKKIINYIAERIIASLRVVDRAGIINNNVICLMLPETSEQGAYKVIQKLKSIINKNSDVRIPSYNITFCSYPDQPACGTSHSNPDTKETTGTSRPALVKLEYSKMADIGEAITLDQNLIFTIEHLICGLSRGRYCKRLIDIFGALCGIILLSPAMILIAITIKITSRGPVLFRQTRLGYQGQEFTFLKFRSMYADCKDKLHKEYLKKFIAGSIDETNMGSQNSPYYKMKNDPRVTPFGKFLRKTSLDELPQFFNVLVGHMSLVGPRPPIPYEVADYKNWHRKRVLDVKPGITGLWQTTGRSTTTFDEMVRLDLYYAQNWTLWLDMKIIFNTFKAVFTGFGAD
jgi:lipopolysaccharide/colanic/teichoic acid biosynthesis glycosyltransferase